MALRFYYILFSCIIFIHSCGAKVPVFLCCGSRHCRKISREFELSEFELTEYSCVNMTESWGEIQGNRTKFELAWSLSYPSSWH